MPEGTYYTPPPKREVRRGAAGPRPHVWLSGPDIVAHEKYVAYIKHKSQAQYRKESHELTFDDWQYFWTVENWSNRGRKNTAVILTRKDTEGPWSKANCVIMSRKAHLIAHGKANIGKKYKSKTWRAANEDTN